ncbi:hypothetical protein HMPREF1255_0148 [Propionimicrobium sp. BV2F7]|nr:hypothetical protein HMPREF1255_0148 [Propionimicrobium sp. BV2F7]
MNEDTATRSTKQPRPATTQKLQDQPRYATPDEEAQIQQQAKTSRTEKMSPESSGDI